MKGNTQRESKLEQGSTLLPRLGFCSHWKRRGCSPPEGGDILWAHLTHSWSTLAGQRLEGRVRWAESRKQASHWGAGGPSYSLGITAGVGKQETPPPEKLTTREPV